MTENFEINDWKSDLPNIPLNTEENISSILKEPIKCELKHENIENVIENNTLGIVELPLHFGTQSENVQIEHKDTHCQCS